MNTPSTSPLRPTRKGQAGRYLFLFLLGLVVGAVGTVMALRAIEARRDHFHESVMHVQAWHLGQLRQSAEQNRCGAADTLRDLQVLRAMVDDIEPAFPELGDNARFVAHTSQLRAALNDALASPPRDCQTLGTAIASIGEACKACHQDFR
jgi:cytochrome c556